MSTITDNLLKLFFPQDNSCQLCGRALWKRDERCICSECARKLSALRIPAADQCTVTEGVTLAVSAYYHA